MFDPNFKFKSPMKTARDMSLKDLTSPMSKTVGDMGAFRRNTKVNSSAVMARRTMG